MPPSQGATAPWGAAEGDAGGRFLNYKNMLRFLFYLSKLPEKTQLEIAYDFE